MEKKTLTSTLEIERQDDGYLVAVRGRRVDGLPEGSDRALAFAAHLLDVIARHELDEFFLLTRA